MAMGEISMRLWFVDDWGKNSYATMDAYLDKQTGRFYVVLHGYDAFAAAKLLPEKWVSLVTVRQEIELYDGFPKESEEPGSYLFEGVVISSDMNRKGSRILSLSGKDVSEVEKAYNLFRSGKLKKEAWQKLP